MVIEQQTTADGIKWIVPRWFVTILTGIAMSWVLWVTGEIVYSASNRSSEYTAIKGVALEARVRANEEKVARLADKEWLTEKFNGIELRLGNLERRTYE